MPFFSKGTSAKYCNWKCRTLKQKTINEDKNRTRILKIYGNKCAICGFDKVLDVHHIYGSKGIRSYKGDISEYIVLCPNHHMMYHRGVLTYKELQKYVIV